MLCIKEIAKKINLEEKDLYCYGNYMAKITKENANKKGKLVLVTAINPTPFGEGKTTVSIGLNDALRKLNVNSVAVLREPSLGPVFGMKGGATGGGKASIVPSDEIDLHFTGDFHAITSANNLLAAAIDNHIYQGNELGFENVVFKRCLDMNDRTLRENFNITAASEVMAIFCLAKDKEDLKERLDNILCGYSKNGKPIYAKELKVTNAMMKLLEKAIVPNLVQSLEENPVIVHGGPFANIAHGCSSVISINTGLSLSNYVITEAGFGSDLGCEKFIDILGQKYNLNPDIIVLVVTLRALKYNGYRNLDLHINNLKKFNIPFVIALNEFEGDTEEDKDYLFEYCKEKDIAIVSTSSYLNGGNGSIDLAKYIVNYKYKPIDVNYVYNDNMKIKTKINNIINNVYLINDIEYSKDAIDALNTNIDISDYSICVAKTQYAYKEDVTKVNVKNIEIHTGSRLIVVLLDKIITMPGLPKVPRYEGM